MVEGKEQSARAQILDRGEPVLFQPREVIMGFLVNIVDPEMNPLFGSRQARLELLSDDDRFFLFWMSGEEIKRTKPAGVQFIDFFEARSLLDRLHIKNKKLDILEKLREYPEFTDKLEGLVEEFYTYVVDTSRRKDTYTLIDRQELLAGEKTLAQIVQGSTIPTFVRAKKKVIKEKTDK